MVKDYNQLAWRKLVQLIPFFRLIGPTVSKQKNKKSNTNSLFACMLLQTNNYGKHWADN